ncbi:lipopolysaccharide biosynthesis protein [Roseateles microcysteis]|uniref:lipopolysaccharide biosynthesis protein n=1 Tax=Roseateles microcysteis TaxID=3119057 RepID=UPI002FE59650
MSTRRAIAFSFLDRYAALALSIGSSVIISRLMTPAEIGVYSVTMVFVSLAAAFRDLGAGQFLLQKRALEPRHLRAVWTVMIAAGCLMALLILLGAWPLSLFYDEPRIVPIMALIALGYVFNSFGAMSYAWLMRSLRFEALAMMRFSATLTGTAVTLLLAWKQYGPISLAWGSLVTAVTNAAVGQYYRPDGFRWWPGREGLREVVSFGSKISLTSVAGVIGGGMSEMALGKLQDLHSVGLYSRANGLAAMFSRLVMDATNAVALPLFARATREHGSSLQPWLRATSYVTVLGWSFAVGVALLGSPLVLLLYGAQWGDAVPPLRWLALAMAINLPAALCTQVLIGAGQADRVLRITMMAALCQLVCTTAGAAISVEAAAQGFALSQVPVALAWLHGAQKQLGFSWSELLALLLRSAACVALVAVVPILLVLRYGSHPAAPLVPLLAALGGGGMLLLLALRLFKHPLWSECLRMAGFIRAKSGFLRG